MQGVKGKKDEIREGKGQVDREWGRQGGKRVGGQRMGKVGREKGRQIENGEGREGNGKAGGYRVGTEGKEKKI